MRRQPPRTERDDIDLYIRTYYSLLRSTGDVRIRGFEEAHIASNSSLHAGAAEPLPDVGAFAYSAARLPECMPSVRRLVLGQSIEHFEVASLPVSGWERVETRGRRRALRWNGGETLAVFITSASDIDDLIPIVTSYQLEWNKMHELLGDSGMRGTESIDVLGQALGLERADMDRLCGALGVGWETILPQIAQRRCDFRVRLLYGSFAQYQRSAHRWWAEIEPHYVGPGHERRPIYFVSSNTHSLSNLVGGYARAHRDEILAFARQEDPEELATPLAEAIETGDEAGALNIMYYLLRGFLHGNGEPRVRLDEVQEFDRESGIQSIASPGRIDVNAQLFELGKIRPERLDPRVRVEGAELLAESDAVIINIDYPLGLAAYHHFSRIAQGAGELRGVYVMGKAATLNARVGDVVIAKAVYDEHSQNSYLFRNCFAAADVQPYMRYGTVLDNQKAVTVRSAFLQNRDYMSVYYNRGYTIMEMEAGPYLSAIYEVVSPKRHPDDEIVHMSTMIPFDVGFIHYASDTPYSRRQHLLSKSMSFFGVESTYGASITILRRILQSEIARLAGR
jgi:hypothetical protein